MNKILVIGNGFDLAHGMPTTYRNFMEAMHHLEINKIYTVTYLRKWISYGVNITGLEDCTTNLADMDNVLSELIEGKNVWYFYYENRLQQQKLKGENWIDFEKEIDYLIPILMKNIGNVNNGNNIVKGIDDFEDNVSLEKLLEDRRKFETALNVYLYVVEKLYIGYLRENNSIIEFIPKELDGVISFNYTSTLENLYNKTISWNNIKYIHGKLSDNNIVIGSSEYPTHPEPIRELGKIATISRRQIGIEHWKFFDPKEERNNIVYFYGHSLGETDSYFLMNVFEWSKEIRIYVHDDASLGNIESRVNKIVESLKYNNINLYWTEREYDRAKHVYVVRVFKHEY